MDNEITPLEKMKKKHVSFRQNEIGNGLLDSENDDQSQKSEDIA